MHQKVDKYKINWMKIKTCKHIQIVVVYAMQVHMQYVSECIFYCTLFGCLTYSIYKIKFSDNIIKMQLKSNQNRLQATDVLFRWIRCHTYYYDFIESICSIGEKRYAWWPHVLDWKLALNEKKIIESIKTRNT